MEPVTLALIVIIVALWLRWRKKRLSVFEDLGIPGPKPNLICGNMYSIVKKGPLVCWKEWAQKYGKVYGYYLGFKPVLYVSDTDLLKQIQIKDFHNFMDRPVLIGNRSSSSFSGALTSEQSKRWKEVRSILTPSFTTTRMKTMMPLMKNAVQMLISNIDEKAKSGEEFNIFDSYQKLTLDVIGRAAFGMSSDVQKEPENRLLRLGRIVFSGNFQSYVLLLGTSFPEVTNLTAYLGRLRAMYKNKGKNPVVELMELLDEIIQERRSNTELRRGDLLQLMLDAEASAEDLKKADSSLLTAGEDMDKEDDAAPKHGSDSPTRERTKDSKHLSDTEVKSNALVFFLAGYETTSNLLTYTTYLLAKHPEVQEEVRREILDLLEREGDLDYGSVNKLKYLDNVISESLRLYPPIIFFVNREALTDVTYDALRIPKGMAIQVPVYDLHYDPEHWTNPDEFNPKRFAPENRSKINNMAYQPFGSGPRNCIGMRFAQMEAKIALAQVLRHFNLELSPRYEKEPPKLKSTFITLTPAEGIYVKAISRNSSQ